MDTRSCYVTQRPNIAMEFQYLKPTFKSGRLTLGIWEAITFGKKGPVYFLAKEGRMTLEIYVNQVLQLLAVLFYEEYLKEIGEMIYINDNAGYHTFKDTKKFCTKVTLLCIIWPAQLLNFNTIENLWYIIKIRVNSHHYHIHSVIEMRLVISEEWEMLTEEDYRKCIKSMHKWYKLVILVKCRSIKYYVVII